MSLTFAAGGVGLSVLASVNWFVYQRGHALIRQPEELSPAKVALVFGAYVYPDGTPCGAVEDRLMTALELYQSGKVQKLLLSGDHGQPDYDEVNGMRAYLEAEGIPKEDLFLDHAGFDTYDSLARARDVFGLQNLILVTQKFHLPRALYIAQQLGLEAQGVVADRRKLRGIKGLRMREIAARIKAFAEVGIERSPKFLGARICMDGDATVTHDLAEEPGQETSL